MTRLDHSKLVVYQRSLDLLELIDSLQNGVRLRAHLRDQLDRAAISIVLNIAEGGGEFSRADKQRFYRMAKRSATEVAAILDIVERRRIATHVRLDPIRSIIIHVVAMLTKLAR